ncbi:MAG: hypothetical protein KME30_01395 [Iphinoe sp. HA4291-MV1]|nr:hypothetical protein [Iphinoe sp. HA4291-MV1]
MVISSWLAMGNGQGARGNGQGAMGNGHCPFLHQQILTTPINGMNFPHAFGGAVLAE